MGETQPGSAGSGSGSDSAGQAATRGGRWLRVGILAGLACFVACALFVFVVDLIPSTTLGDLFSTGSGNPFAARVARDALSAWNRQYLQPSTNPEVPSASTSGLVFGGVLVLVLVLLVIGVVVKRRVAPSLRERALTLAVTSLVCAAIAGAIAAADSYSSGGARFTHYPLTYAVSALILTAVIGGYAFGVVGLLPRVIAATLRRAAWLVGVCFVATGLLFPAFVALGHERPGSRMAHFAHASTCSAAIGGMAIPLALQAPISADTTMIVPFVVASDFPNSTQIEGEWPSYPWQSLLFYLNAHPHTRLARYAATVGPWGTATGIVLTLAVVAGLVGSTVGLCRRQRPPTVVSALALGAVQGASVALLVVLLAGLSGNVIATGAPANGRDLWGVPALSLLYTAVVTTGLCGATGLVFALAAKRNRDQAKPPCAATSVMG